MKYEVVLRPDPQKFIERLRDKKLQARIVAALRELAKDPMPYGCLKMQGTLNEWRIRVGDYRIIYTVEDNVLRVLVIRIGHRKEVYD